MPSAVLAYLDPNTTSSLFALLAPLAALGGVFLGALLWPLRKVLGRFRKPQPPVPAEPPEPDPHPQA